MFALWLDPDEWDDATIKAIGERADVAAPDGIIVATFQRLVDEAWASVTAFLNETLVLLPWASGAWLSDSAGFDGEAHTQRTWHDPIQRLLFRWPA